MDLSAAHFHLIMNHIPVIGTIAVFLFFLAGAVRRNEETKKIALLGFVVVALFTIPVFLTGEPSEDIVKGLPGVSQQIIEQHEEWAEASLTAIEILGALSLLALILGLRGRRPPSWVMGLVFGAAVISIALVSYTANLGGQVRHSEIRSASAATSAPAAVDDDD